MKKYYVSFTYNLPFNANNIYSDPNNRYPRYGDLFIDVDRNLNEKAIKNLKASIIGKFKLPKETAIVFTNIMDLSKTEMEEDPISGSNTLSESMEKENDPEMEEQIKQFISENVHESVNGQEVDSVETYEN